MADVAFVGPPVETRPQTAYMLFRIRALFSELISVVLFDESQIVSIVDDEDVSFPRRVLIDQHTQTAFLSNA